MTASRLDGVGVPVAADLLLAQPAVVARPQIPALALGLGLAGLAVASAVVGWILFGDTNPALWTYGYWPVRELMPAAIAFHSAARRCSAMARRAGPPATC